MTIIFVEAHTILDVLRGKKRLTCPDCGKPITIKSAARTEYFCGCKKTGPIEIGENEK